MRDLRLKLIAEVDFRKSEETNFLELEKEGKIPRLKKGEGVLFISRGKDQIVFVEKFERFTTENRVGRSVDVCVVPSQRFRIRGSKWDNLMLQNYANRAGFNIAGIKRFEWHLKQQRLRKAA